jgi:AraC-like DNA-binding protein
MIAEDGPRTGATALVGYLARAVQKIATAPGDHVTALPELTLHRRNRPSQPVHCIYTLGMALTVQGSKHVLLGEKELSYGPGQSLLTTIDLPVSYHITRATSAEPYLGMMLKFDMSLITQVASKMEAVRTRKTRLFEPISIQRLDASVLDALHRLLLLLDEPTLIPQLAPLIQQEIIIRLLTGPHASHLWHMVNATGATQQISRAVTWIRQNFAEEMRVEEIAKHASMSPTTFRQHFRAITGMSPVQFQKLLRLQEARQLMIDQHMTAGAASAVVGYESASQFNREYRRLFGAPPQHDIRRMQPH